MQEKLEKYQILGLFFSYYNFFTEKLKADDFRISIVQLQAVLVVCFQLWGSRKRHTFSRVSCFKGCFDTSFNMKRWPSDQIWAHFTN